MSKFWYSPGFQLYFYKDVINVKIFFQLRGGIGILFDANFKANKRTRYDNDSSLQFRILSASKMSVLNKATMRLTERGENNEN